MKNIIVALFFIYIHGSSQNNLIDNDSLKQGYWQLFFPYNANNIISEEGHFINDQEDGLWIKYHENGQV